jgi:Ni,Fe-hydrogenase maturation factor
MSPTAAPARFHPFRTLRTLPRPTVIHLLVCGSQDRGDDGAPLLAASRIRANLPPDVRLKVDAATGIRSGSVVELPLSGLVDHAGAIRPRSSHALEIPEVVAVADMIRGQPLPGRVVAIGTRSFGLGKALSASVARAIPALSQAILDAIDHVRVAALAARPT